MGMLGVVCDEGLKIKSCKGESGDKGGGKNGACVLHLF